MPHQILPVRGMRAPGDSFAHPGSWCRPYDSYRDCLHGLQSAARGAFAKQIKGHPMKRSVDAIERSERRVFVTNEEAAVPKSFAADS